MHVRLGILLVSILLVLAPGVALASPKGLPLDSKVLNDVRARPDSVKRDLNDLGIDWCGTQLKFLERNPGAAKDASCFVGTCDNATNRDAAIPGALTPVKTVQLVFHIFSNDDGSNPASSAAGAAAQLVQLNSDYAPSHFQFVASWEFVNDSRFRVFSDADEATMKNTYADSPGTQLNIYVVTVTGGYLGIATFPWDTQARTNLGGIIMDESAFGQGKKTLTHEVGHCLGLWHTHHGVTEETTCSTCYERADGLNGDTTGDLCADTAPTPVNFNCSGPGGSDQCSSTLWGATDPQNYMGYAPDSCYSEFSPQQQGRMQCWTESNESAWFVPSGQGQVNLDRLSYGCSDTMQVRMFDDDLAGAGTAIVTASATNGDSETLALTEIPGLPGYFRGSQQTSGTAGAPNDGALNIIETDTLTVTYADASNGNNQPAVSTVTAFVDCTGPVISNVTVAFVADTGAQVTFDTDEDTVSGVRFGNNCGFVPFVANASGTRSHSALLTGLVPNTTYHFKVIATDASNNETQDDDHGICYSFTTESTYDFLSEDFSGTPDLAFLSITFTPDQSPEGFGVCTETIGNLPTSNSGSTPVTLGDDDTVQISLASGRTFPYFGTQYSTLWINSNGNITFDGGSLTALGSLNTHFARPRISTMFDDFDPSAGGSVLRKQTADRFAVTYTSVPEYGETNATTMQTELFFDGRIRMSYLTVQASPAYGKIVVGLSRGFGAGVISRISDLSRYINCASFTPFVAPYISGSPWAEEGRSASLRILSTGLEGVVLYAWTRGGVPIGTGTDTYTMNSVTLVDQGVYRATVSDASKRVYHTDPFWLDVVPSGALPVAGLGGLSALTAAIAVTIASRRVRHQ